MMKTAHFLDFTFNTENNAFFPRPETEILVEKVLECLSEKKGLEHPYNILDIGTGCGNIAISLTKYLSSSKIVASDISDEALRTASGNARVYGASECIDFIKSDLFRNLSSAYRLYFDLIVSNPPYISLADFSTLPEEVHSDPYRALYGGKDGLKFYREIVKYAPMFLKKKGLLMMEAGYDQAAHIKEMLTNSGFVNIAIYKDYSGVDRIIKAENG